MNNSIEVDPTYLNEYFVSAFMMQDFDTVVKLVEEGKVDPNYYSRERKKTILYTTLEKGRRDIAKRLLQMGANPNITNPETGDSPLFNACEVWDIESAKLLLEFGANPNQMKPDVDITTFHYICSRPTDSKEMVDLLLNYGADPDSMYTNGMSILSTAIELENVSLIDSLAKKRYRKRETILLCCIREYCEDSLFHNDNLPLDMFREIMKETRIGANLNIPIQCRNPKTQSLYHEFPLTTAARMNHIEMVKVFLENGADPNNFIELQGGASSRALEAASFNKNEEMVKVLLDHGADPNLRDFKN
jgi:ankyrin repeat protein